MAANATLSAAPREGNGKSAAHKLRAGGRVPAVVYGHGEETRSVSVDAHEVEQLFKRISVENTLITLTIEEGGRTKGGELRALVREVQTHPARATILHVDFYQIHAGERVFLDVPIHMIGTAAGVKAGGLLQHGLSELSVRCLADQIPEAFEVDVSGLEIGDSVHVRDLVIPDGVEVDTDGDITVCSVIPPVVAAVEEPAEEEIVGVGGEVQPELIRRHAEEAAEQEEE